MQWTYRSQNGGKCLNPLFSMKVLYILHIAEMHGSIISLFNTIAGQKVMGIEPVLVIPDGRPCDEGFAERVKELGTKCYRVPLVQSIVSKDAYNAWPFMQRIRFFYSIYRRKYYSYKLMSKIVRSERPSIIHTNSGVIHEGYWAAKRYGIPHVFHIREYQDKDFEWKIIPSKSIFCWMLKHSHVITITNALNSHFRLEKCRNAYTIYNGIYSQKKTSLIFPKEDYFFCASRISKEKGFDDVILSFAEYAKTHPTYKLLLAGEGSKSYIEQLKELALTSNCNDKVVFLGAIDNVFDYMKKARALIVGSYNEGFGRMTAEAAFAGCLVIGRNTGGTKEILDKTGGFRFENLEELVASMNKVTELKDNAYKEKARYAQCQATEWFSTEQNIEKVYSLYQEIVK